MGSLTSRPEHRVSLGKIKIPSVKGVEKFEHKDGSFSCRIWNKQRSELKLELVNSELSSFESNFSPYGTKNIVPTVKERELLYNVVIIKNSAHVFTVVISSKVQTVYAKCKSYDEINEVLGPLIKKIK